MRKFPGIFIALAVVVAIAIFWKCETPRMDPPSVLAQVRRLNQLATVKYTIQTVIVLTNAGIK